MDQEYIDKLITELERAKSNGRRSYGRFGDKTDNTTLDILQQTLTKQGFRVRIDYCKCGTVDIIIDIPKE